MIIDEIKVILENNEYELDSDTISRIQTMLESIRENFNLLTQTEDELEENELPLEDLL